ncbi:thiamine phosphate synthase [Loktanella sp. DJP18]|uniref:thiamine phosphate synthase n=1 Tax=Loktanella sp. DJP18 TaxID=3409788 RepID=UPI003BB59192
MVNDDIDAASAAEVDGVHLGQDDVKVSEARARLGPDAIIGLSCETVDQVRAADPGVVDYLGIETRFPTASKPDHKPRIGLRCLAELVGSATLQSVAIGGLKQEHAAGLLAAGCEGMAVVSAICGQPDTERAARALRHALDMARAAAR